MIVIHIQDYDCKIVPLNTTYNLQKSSPSIHSIVIPSSQGLNVVELKDIVYLKSDSNYTTLRLVNETEYMVSKTLKTFDIKLKDTFLRVHNSYLINPYHIKSFCFKKSKLYLKGKIEVPVSRTKKSVLLNYLKDFSI